jgi:CheY-like chemotaxis protein
MRALTVLVAEDDPGNYQLVRAFLDSLGHKVVWARNGGEALLLAQSGRFELMLLDLHMPVLNGIQVIRAIRARPICDNLHVIAVTADHAAHQREKLLVVGVDGFMTKPLDLVRLASEVGQVAARLESSLTGSS